MPISKKSFNSLPSSTTIALALLPLLALAFCSCGVLVSTRSLLGETLDLEVHIADMANQDNPVAMDVILVYDEDLLKKLLQLSAKEWFEQKAQFKKDYPEDSGFEVWEREWIPVANTYQEHLSLRGGAVGGIIFAGYRTDGAHRYRLELYQDVRVMLDGDDMSVEPMP
jgi:type VI secretion system protein